MNTRIKNGLGWGLSALVCLLLIASAVDKIMGSDHALEMSASFGISPWEYKILGIIEIVSAILFLIPRTSILGLLLLSSYFGGAIATHLQHQQEIIFPGAIEAFAWITAIIRFPELSQRLMGRLEKAS